MVDSDATYCEELENEKNENVNNKNIGGLKKIFEDETPIVFTPSQAQTRNSVPYSLRSSQNQPREEDSMLNSEKLSVDKGENYNRLNLIRRRLNKKSIEPDEAQAIKNDLLGLHEAMVNKKTKQSIENALDKLKQFCRPEIKEDSSEPGGNVQCKRKATEETNEGVVQKKRQRKDLPQPSINESDGLVNLNLTQEEIQEAKDLLNKSILLKQNDCETYKIIHEKAEQKLFSIAGRSKEFYEKYVKSKIEAQTNPIPQTHFNPVAVVQIVSSPKAVNQEQPKSPIVFQPSEQLFSTNTFENLVADDSYITPRQRDLSIIEYDNLSNEEFYKQKSSTPAFITEPSFLKFDVEQIVPKQDQVMTMKVLNTANQNRQSSNMKEKENQPSPIKDVFSEQGCFFTSLHLRLLAQRLCLNEQFLK